MPTPTDTKSLQEISDVIQHLSKFSPQLSTIAEPLRQLVHKDVEWNWLLQVHNNAVAKLKEIICKAPVFKYFDVTKEIALQHDVSESGLSCALLMQEGQPITFGA